MKRYKVPEEMLEAFWAEYSGGLMGPESRRRSVDGLEAALRWLNDEILHERNVDFHLVILQRGKERYPDNMVQRVAFEFGVSFARHYLRDLFVAPEPEPKFDEVWNALTVEINRVGMRKATEILRSQAKNDLKGVRIRKTKSAALAAIHEAAEGLHKAGVIDNMKEFDDA